jgi:hypothetical protein
MGRQITGPPSVQENSGELDPGAGGRDDGSLDLGFCSALHLRNMLLWKQVIPDYQLSHFWFVL